MPTVRRKHARRAKWVPLKDTIQRLLGFLGYSGFHGWGVMMVVLRMGDGSREAESLLE